MHYKKVWQPSLLATCITLLFILINLQWILHKILAINLQDLLREILEEEKTKIAFLNKWNSIYLKIK